MMRQRESKIISSAMKKQELLCLFLLFISIDLSQGVTKCGWIFRNNLVNPSLSLFKASYNLTAIPIINATTAWCIPVKNHSLTVNLGSVTNITRLAVQGEEGTENYVTSYEVDHSKDGIVFSNIKNGLKPQCSAKEFFGAFPGLSSGSDVAETNLSISFRAQYVRFRPQESVGALCTRIDIYGCQSDDGFTNWSQWGSCFSTPQTPTSCSRSRTRTCENRSEGCKGTRNETEACRRNLCTRECGELGIIDENRSINDTAFLASTYKPGFEAYRARLNGLSAWCASVNDQNQYLEIDFGGETQVKEIKTQGLERGNKSAWVKEFFLDFRRSDGSLWEDYRENNSVRIYDGNKNGSMVKTYILADPPSARFIRFYPLDWHEEICLRVSASGCRVSPIFGGPVAADKEEEVDEAFWIILWILLGLLLLLLLLGLLYLCCRYCPCCACCGCCPCVKKRKKKTDGAMMTELTGDEIDAPPRPRVQYATGATQTDGGLAQPETETQTVAIHLDGENGRADAGPGAVYFSRRDGTDISEARTNEGMQSWDDQTRIATTSGLSSSRREEMMSSESRDRVDGARAAGRVRDTSRERVEEQRTASSRYEREEYRSSATTSGRGEYLGRYDVEVSQTPLAPPPVVQLEVTPDMTDGTWRVETLDQVNQRLAHDRRQHGLSELEYQGVSYRGVNDRNRSKSVDVLDTSDIRSGGIVVRLDGLDRRGGVTTSSNSADYRDSAEYTVHLRDCAPEGLARLEATEVDSRTARDRYHDQDTYRARHRARQEPEVETWKVKSIRGQAFQGTINVDTSRGHVTGQPFHYQAPLSPSSSDISSISQYDGSSVSEQYNQKESKKQFYKMFEYSRD
ncbi:coadhesin-like [Dendronephthya gigantea]|uniref:coadhesin-like n=1 Tax=Dendronephthya gigantea TaxID=151771 RepID=UPI0010692D4C|nr:coadhesin-like [Dendronephthya gigantea]